MTAQPGTTSGSQAKLQAGVALGDYVLGQPLWPLRIADAYRANGPSGPATIYVIHASLARTPEVRDQIIAGTRAAAALPEHKHLVRTLAAGLTGDILWIATEEVEGQLVRDMLIKKLFYGEDHEIQWGKMWKLAKIAARMVYESVVGPPSNSDKK